MVQVRHLARAWPIGNLPLLLFSHVCNAATGALQPCPRAGSALSPLRPSFFSEPFERG